MTPPAHVHVEDAPDTINDGISGFQCTPAGRSRLRNEPTCGSTYCYLSSGFFSSFFGGRGFCAGGGVWCCGCACGRGGGACGRTGGAARSSLTTGGAWWTGG